MIHRAKPSAATTASEIAVSPAPETTTSVSRPLTGPRPGCARCSQAIFAPATITATTAATVMYHHSEPSDVTKIVTDRRW